MSVHQIQDSQLTVGASVLVRGNVTFSRITRRLEGEELKNDQARRRTRGQIPIDKPYVTISICNATIVPKVPNTLTPDEQYVAERFYTSQKPEKPGMNFTIDSKSQYLPYISQVKEGNPREVDQVKPLGEPATGLDVVLVLRIFQSSNYGGMGRKGVTLDGIIAQEPIRYYTSNNAALLLKERGITYNALPPEELESMTQQAANNTEVDNSATPAGTQVAPPTGNPFSTNDPNVNPFAGMNPPENPGMNPRGNTGTGFMNAVPAGGSNPYANNQAVQGGNPAQHGGIQYDPTNPV